KGKRHAEIAELRYFSRCGTGDVDAGAGVAGRRWQADDAAVDILGAGTFEHRADLDRGFRRDGVAVDIDRLLARARERRLHPLGERDRFTRRTDREEEIG